MMQTMQAVDSLAHQTIGASIRDCGLEVLLVLIIGYLLGVIFGLPWPRRQYLQQKGQR